MFKIYDPYLHLEKPNSNCIHQHNWTGLCRMNIGSEVELMKSELAFQYEGLTRLNPGFRQLCFKQFLTKLLSCFIRI